VRAQYGEAAAVQPHVQRFAEYLGHCDALGVGPFIKFDLTIVRGLAYYTGIVFELFDAVGEFRAICGGGRYDQLLASLGGTDLPALGFGMGDVVLGELLRARGRMPAFASPLDVWVAQEPLDGQVPAETLRTAHALRQAGCVVEYALRAQRLDKQMEAARKAGARHVVIVEPAAAGRLQYRVRSAGLADVLWESLEALQQGVSSLTGTAI